MKRVLASIVALALGAGIAQAQDTLPIRIGAAGATDHAPVFVGVENGIFASHGLDAKVTMYQSGVDMVNGLLNGAQEVNVMGSVPYLTGVAKGFPLVLIAHLHGDPTQDHYAANESLIASEASGVKAGDIPALKDKRIGLPRGSGAEAYVLGLLGEAGLKPSDVTLVNLGPAELITALQQNDVDAIAAWQPWGATALAEVAGSVAVQQGGCNSCYDPGTILSTKDVIAKDPEALKRFMVAFAEAQQWTRQNPEEAAKISMRWIQGVKPEVMTAALKASKLDPRISKYTAEMYQAKTLPFLVSLGRIDKVYDPSPAIDTQFLDYAEKTTPDAFSDLPPIPADLQVK